MPKVIYSACRKKSQTDYSWLRERTSWVDYGFKYMGHPIHCNKNERVIECFNAQAWSELYRMTNAKYDDHFLGLKSFYFSGNPDSQAPETLAIIDIDCHEVGSLSEAKKFAEWLKKYHYPDLFIEPSKRGYHAYLCVRKLGLGAQFINEGLKRLQQHLRTLLAESGFNVELVEVKGALPIITWGEEPGAVNNYKSGQLAMLPRERHRFPELRATTRLNAYDLMRLNPVEKGEKTTPSLPNNTVRTFTGSISGQVIDEAELQNLAHYRQVAARLMESHTISTTGRAVATVEDVAITFMLLKFFHGNMNADGTLPVARVGGLWTALSGAGDVERAWEPKRFAAIRNWLSSLGLIDWQDHSYQIGMPGKRGRACKWRPSELLISMLQVPETVETSVGAGELECGNSVEERGASFIGTDLLTTIVCLFRSKPDTTMKPVLKIETSWYRPSGDELDHLITHFDYSTAA